MKTKDSTITIRCTKAQKDTIERKAKKKGLNNSNYIINQCIGHNRYRYKTKDDRDTCKAVVEMQGTLNDLENVANCCGPYSAELNRLINLIREKEKIIWRNSLR